MTSQHRQLFGTDGIRGVAGEFPLTADSTFLIGRALGHDLLRTNRAARVVRGSAHHRWQGFDYRPRGRAVVEPFMFRCPADKEESLETFVLRRLGRDFLDYAINPLVGGSCVRRNSPTRTGVSSLSSPRLLPGRIGTVVFVHGSVNAAITRRVAPIGARRGARGVLDFEGGKGDRLLFLRLGLDHCRV